MFLPHAQGQALLLSRRCRLESPKDVVVPIDFCCFGRLSVADFVTSSWGIVREPNEEEGEQDDLAVAVKNKNKFFFGLGKVGLVF